MVKIWLKVIFFIYHMSIDELINYYSIRAVGIQTYSQKQEHLVCINVQ